MPQIVETVTADTMAELRARRDRATDVDMVELRLDYVRDIDVAGALEGRRRPVIVTCRAKWEGGRFEGSEEERLAILVDAARRGAEYVDVEWQADRRALADCAAATRVVVSSHDFTGVPVDLDDRVRAMHGLGGHVVKVAVTASSLRDCVILKRAFADAGEHVAIAMGPAGQLTRLWPAWIGSAWTYGGVAAPGQISTHDLIHRYRARTTTAATICYGVAGSPIGHSASPAMHNAAFHALGLDAVYVPLETACAEDLLAVGDEIPLAGVSVTIPLKQALLASAVVADELPTRIGALNTLRRGQAGWEGRNFDVAGFLDPLDRRSVRLRDRRAVVLGAGGSARAAVSALISHGAKVSVAARRPEAARAVAQEFGAEAIAWPPVGAWDVLVNTTPVGMWPRVTDSPLAAGELTPATGAVVYDLIYNPMPTQLLRLAAEAGAETIGGLEMLVSQACQQFHWWTGQRAPRDVMDEAARTFIQAQR